ncbi:3-phosphoshikimate 1-carboxyvinyltransferase [Bacillaceae bacterium W0354]
MKTIHANSKAIRGTVNVPGDKSISHRAVIFGSLANGETEINHFLESDDCQRTIEAFRQLGVSIEKNKGRVIIKSNGIKEFISPKHEIYLGNSGTTARLFLGVCAALPFEVTLTGDDSLQNRPMSRVINPLKQMGAEITSRNGKLPISIQGGGLTPIRYELPVDSAQIKSAILLAGLLTEGQTTVIQNNVTRDHTERLITEFGGKINEEGNEITIDGSQQLIGASFDIPGDISSAANWIVAAIISPNSEITINNVGLNPTRTGLIHALKRMGANIEVATTNYVGKEPVGTVVAKYSKLQPTTIQKNEIPLMVDEIPLLALAATQADGKMTIDNLQELRYKETDRIHATVDILSKLGADVAEGEQSIIINGPSKLTGGAVDSFGDHRMAMVAAIAALVSENPVSIENETCVSISYPTFYSELGQLLQS